jgi:hypothetical protein
MGQGYSGVMRVRVRNYFKPSRGIHVRQHARSRPQGSVGGGPAKVTIKRARRAITRAHSEPIGMYPVGVTVHHMQRRDPSAVA